jgi:hypothetical protein
LPLIILGVQQNLAIHHIELDVGNGTFLMPYLEIIGKEFTVITFQELGHDLSALI